MKLPQSSRAHAPRQKLRGKKRFFRKVMRDAEDFQVPSVLDDWRDFWHYHADWDGYGNLGWSYRRRFVEALAVVFETIAKTRQPLDAPYQAWILLDSDDAGQDATFFHTPNPNRDNFPWKPESVEWGQRWLEVLLKPMLPGFILRAGVYSWRDSGQETQQESYVIYSPDFGASLE